MKILLISEYKCATKKCKVGQLWNGKPIQLLLNRINGIHTDLTIDNLELLCPNCYIVKHGLELFKKKLVQATYNCQYCGYNLSSLGNQKKKDRVCYSCEKKIFNLSNDSLQAQYIEQLQSKITDTNTNTNTNTSSFAHGQKSSSSYSGYKKSSNRKPTNGANKEESLIQLNTETLPDISDLII
jgi:hypothetical protein